MRRARRFVPILAGMLGSTALWAASSTGCSGGGNSTSGAQDAASDSTSIDSSSTDTGVDSSTSDTGSPGIDTGSPPADTGSPPADSSTPPADASDSGAGPDADAGSYDASAAATAFVAQVATAICDDYALCCGQTPDAGTFNWQKCYQAFLPQGYQGSSAGYSLIANGNVNFDPNSAQSCLSQLAAVDCKNNQITASEITQLSQACFAAFTGTLSAGSPCFATIECTPGTFCLPTDGGAGDAGQIGTCQALAGQGGACGILGSGSVAAQSVCSYKGSGSNGLGCESVVLDAGSFTRLPLNEWTCQPQSQDGVNCGANQSCTSQICRGSSQFTCMGTGAWALPSTCNFYYVDGG
jgi:hypothetical protein